MIEEISCCGYRGFAGGASNISHIAYILNCLGFPILNPLFDGDKEKEFDKFNEEFNDEYMAWILPADDIRDKPEYNKESKLGLLDENFQLKTEYNNEELKRIFSEMIEFSLES